MAGMGMGSRLCLTYNDIHYEARRIRLSAVMPKPHCFFGLFFWPSVPLYDSADQKRVSQKTSGNLSELLQMQLMLREQVLPRLDQLATIQSELAAKVESEDRICMNRSCVPLRLFYFCSQGLSEIIQARRHLSLCLISLGRM